MKLYSRLAFVVLYILAILCVALWALVMVAEAADPLLKVAIVDTGLDRNDPRFEGRLCEKGHYNFVEHKSATTDLDGHGTYMAGLITKFASKVPYCLLIYKFYDAESTNIESSHNVVLAIQMAIKEGATLINLSFGGGDFVREEYLALKNAPKSVTFIAAAGNNGKELNSDDPEIGIRFYPASYKLPNVTVVGALKANGARLKASNYGPDVVAWETGEGVLAAFPGGSNGMMSGSSVAAAIYLARAIAYRGLKP